MKRLLFLISFLVPIGCIQPASGSTVYLGWAEGIIVTTNYRSSELGEGKQDEANVLLGARGGRNKFGQIAGTSMTFGGGTVKTGAKKEVETPAGVDDWDRAVEASKLCNQALLYMQRDRVSRAIKTLDQAIVIDPKHVQARMLRGVAAEKQKNHQEAIKYYNHALSLDPNYAKIYQSRGISYMGLENNEEAIRDFTKAMELDPKFIEAYLKRGLLYGKLGRYEESIADNTAAIALDPQNILAYNNRSAAYKALGKLNEARSDILMLNKLRQLPKK